MSTTVPQNIGKGHNLMGSRHKPTRNSLRHSRLIVKNFQGEIAHVQTLDIIIPKIAVYLQVHHIRIR